MGAGNTTIYAQWQIVDTTAPSLSMTSTIGNLGVLYQGNAYVANTFTFSDSQSGIYGYYWGTTYPTATNVTYTTYSGSSVVLNNTGGTYYFAVKDNVGNISIAISRCQKGLFGGEYGTKNIYTAGYTTFYATGGYYGYGISAPDGTAITYGTAWDGCCINNCNNYTYLTCNSPDGSMQYLMFN